MRLLNINGKLINKNVSKFRIKWNGKSASKIQFRTKQFLKRYWENHIVYEEFPVYGTKLRVDIINFTKKIAIEVNGGQHYNYNKFFHANSRVNYLNSIKRDWQKTEWLEMNNFKLIELIEPDIDNLSLDFIEDKFEILIV